MKKILFYTGVALALTLASCSKESKLNRKLDGKWETVSYDGVAVAADEITTLTFAKEKKGKGTVDISSSFLGTTISFKGNYVLEDDKKLTMYVDYLELGMDTTVFNVNEYSKSKLILVDQLDGEKIEFKKK